MTATSPTRPRTSSAELAERVLAGDRPAVARAISWVENRPEEAEDLLDRLFARAGDAWRVGVTGPPGGGKSTLVAALTGMLRAEGLKVGVLAVDPTSPYTGGALLGDRVRMTDHHGDDDVFIRSMATRGSLGGLAAAAENAGDVLAAWGADVVVLETVGVGQSEVDVAAAADSTLLVLYPEAGDGVQAMKAGLMEAVNVIAINKCDRPGGENLEREVRAVLQLRRAEEGDWPVPVHQCSAQEGEGLDELLADLRAHHKHMQDTGALARHRLDGLAARTRTLTESRVRRRLWQAEAAALSDAVQRLETREISPYALSRELATDFLGDRA